MPDRDRHELATVVVDGNSILTLAASTNEKRWLKVNDLFGGETKGKDSRAAALVKQTNFQFMADQFGTASGKTVGGIGVRDEYIQKFK